LGADAGIIPLFHDKNVMRDFSDENGLWAAVLTVLKTRVPAKDLDMNRHLLESTDTVNMSRFLQKLEHCNGEDSTKLHNHFKQSILKIKGFGINPDSKQGVVVLVSSFTGKLGNWASDHSTEIYELTTIDDLIDYIRVGFSIEDVEGKNLYILLRLEQGEKSLHDYTQEFNTSYAWWKKSIDIKAAVYMYIGGLKNGALRADLMTNWQSGKYLSIIALQNDAAKNSLWRSTSSLTMSTNNSNSGERKGKGAAFPNNFKKSNGSNGSFSSNNNKGFSVTKKWSKSKDGASGSKGFTKSAGIDKGSKRKVSFTEKPYEAWNKAKSKLTEEEYNKRRRTNACINCGEVGHKFSDCPKPKP
jgi:hypothetical protein